MGFFQNLKQKPEKEKRRILSAIAAAAAIILVFSFIFNVKAKFSSFKAIPKGTNDSVFSEKSSNFLKDSFGTLKEMGNKTIEEFKKLNSILLKENANQDND